MSPLVEEAWAALDLHFAVVREPFEDFADDGPRAAVGLFLPFHDVRDGVARPVLALRGGLDAATVLDVAGQLFAALDDTRPRHPMPTTPFGRPGLWLVPTRRRFRRNRRYYW